MPLSASRICQLKLRLSFRRTLKAQTDHLLQQLVDKPCERKLENKLQRATLDLPTSSNTNLITTLTAIKKLMPVEIKSASSSSSRESRKVRSLQECTQEPNHSHSTVLSNILQMLSSIQIFTLVLRVTEDSTSNTTEFRETINIGQPMCERPSLIQFLKTFTGLMKIIGLGQLLSTIGLPIPMMMPWSSTRNKSESMAAPSPGLSASTELSAKYQIG